MIQEYQNFAHHGWATKKVLGCKKLLTLFRLDILEALKNWGGGGEEDRGFPFSITQEKFMLQTSNLVWS